MSPTESEAASPAGGTDRPSQRIRERMLSGLFAFFVAMLVVVNAPVSSERAAVLRHFAPPVDLLHLNQNWAVFSPDPSTISVEFWADVVLVSGESVRFEYPSPGDWASVYTNYRFRKYQRRMVENGNEHLWERAAEQIRHEFDEPVSSVTLFRNFTFTPMPGTDQEPVSTLDELMSFSFADDALGAGQ